VQDSKKGYQGRSVSELKISEKYWKTLFAVFSYTILRYEMSGESGTQCHGTVKNMGQVRQSGGIEMRIDRKGGSGQVV
jgi:hypothetical protein